MTLSLDEHLAQRAKDLTLPSVRELHHELPNLNLKVEDTLFKVLAADAQKPCTAPAGSLYSIEANKAEFSRRCLVDGAGPTTASHACCEGLSETLRADPRVARRRRGQSMSYYFYREHFYRKFLLR